MRRVSWFDMGWALVAAVAVVMAASWVWAVVASIDSRSEVVPGTTPTATRLVPGPTVTVTVTAEPEPAPTVTVTRKAAAGRSEPRVPEGFAAWLASPIGKRISWRESHNICSITNPTGKYQGKWQMDDNFWRAYGGLKYAPNPHQATCHEQDLVAYRGWLARGWQPWGE